MYFRFSNIVYGDKISEVLDKKKPSKNDVIEGENDGTRQ